MGSRCCCRRCRGTSFGWLTPSTATVAEGGDSGIQATGESAPACVTTFSGCIACWRGRTKETSVEQVLNSRVAQPGVTPSGLYRAPGAPDVFVEDGVYYLTYHAYRPVNTLGIRPMNWHDGWPYFNEPGGGPYDLRDRGYYRLVNQDGIISEPDSLQNPEA